jgi:hypothetical protein
MSAALWDAMVAHQPVADALGYGTEWMDMCEQRTAKTAQATFVAAGRKVLDAVDAAQQCAGFSDEEKHQFKIAEAAADAQRASGTVFQIVQGGSEELIEQAIEYVNMATGYLTTEGESK